MEVNEEVKKIVLDKSDLLFKLLLYLKENQDKTAVSKENVARYLRKEELSSRMTTFGIIDDLVREGILLDNKIMNYQSNLRINPEYDFDGLIENVLRSHTQQLYLKLAKLVQFTKFEGTEYTLNQLIEASKLLSSFTEKKDKILNRKTPEIPLIMNEKQQEKKIIKHRKKVSIT